MSLNTRRCYIWFTVPPWPGGFCSSFQHHLLFLSQQRALQPFLTFSSSNLAHTLLPLGLCTCCYFSLQHSSHPLSYQISPDLQVSTLMYFILLFTYLTNAFGAYQCLCATQCGTMLSLGSLFFFFFYFFFIFFNYEKMITHLPETWKIQNNGTYSSTIYFNYFSSR